MTERQRGQRKMAGRKERQNETTDRLAEKTPEFANRYKGEYREKYKKEDRHSEKIH